MTPADPGDALIVGMLYGAGAAWLIGLAILHAAGIVTLWKRRPEREFEWDRRHDR